VGDMAPARKGCESRNSRWGWFYGNQVGFSPKEDLVQGKVDHAPRHPKGINTTPWAPQDGYQFRSIHHNSAKPRNKHRRETMAAARPQSCLGDGLGRPWSSGASWGHQWYVLSGDDLNVYITMWEMIILSSDLLSDSMPPFMLSTYCEYAYSFV
jgi:hypothetical protein